jgi:aryl-alcohol dehydrogenase-like predicted oxidoreductase
LTGKYLPGKPVPAASRAASDSMKGFFNPTWLKLPLLRAVQSLQPLAAQAGLSLAQFALAWVLREPNVAAAITGASRPEQIDENVAASGHIVPGELFERAERILDEALASV